MPKISLVMTRPLVLPQHVEIEAERITLGRSKSCTCLIEDRFLSRTHAELVARDGKWFIRDCDSANGTFVNGARIDREMEFRREDVVTIGDTEIRMGGTKPQDEITQVGVDSAPATAPAPAPEPEPEQVPDLVIKENEVKESAERTRIVHRLALELLEDRSASELFDVIVDHVMEAMNPSRVAIALLEEDGESLSIVKFRGAEDDPDARLTISRTLLSQIIEQREVIAFTDIGAEDGVIPESMAVQGIFSALGAPLLVSGGVLGLLYLDYRLSDRVIREDDAQLAAQIARVAAIKLAASGIRGRRGINKADILDLYGYNEWANASLIDVVCKLDQETRTRDLGGSHRTIRNVLSHIVSAEWIWLERWQGNNPTEVPDWVDAAGVEALVDRLAGIEKTRKEFLEGLSEEELREVRSYRLLNGTTVSQPLVDLILHIVDHSTYHRGQLASMIRQCDIAPPPTSLLEYRRVAAQATTSSEE